MHTRKSRATPSGHFGASCVVKYENGLAHGPEGRRSPGAAAGGAGAAARGGRRASRAACSGPSASSRLRCISVARLLYEKLRKSGSSSSSDDAHRLMRSAPSRSTRDPPGVVGVGVMPHEFGDIGFFGEVGHVLVTGQIGDERHHGLARTQPLPVDFVEEGRRAKLVEAAGGSEAVLLHRF